MLVRTSPTFYLLWFLLTSAEAWRNFRVIFDNATVTNNKNWATVDLDLKTVNDDSVIDLHINVLKPITVAWIYGYIRFDSLSDLDSDNITSIEVINKTANLCQLLAARKTMAPIVRLSLNEFAKFGTFFTECPIRKAHYYLQHFKMDEELLPAYLPETDFFARVHVFTNSSASKADIWDITLIGRIDSSKGLDNLKLFTQG